MKIKKVSYFALIVFVVLAAVFGAQKYVKADDDDEREEEREEEDEDEDEDEERRSPSTVIDTKPEEKSSKKTETVTEYVKLSDTVTQVITTITRHDSDGDGMYDDEDPHPTINEYFIVKDEDLNGIDDRYEQ